MTSCCGAPLGFYMACRDAKSNHRSARKRRGVDMEIAKQRSVERLRLARGASARRASWHCDPERWVLASERTCASWQARTKEVERRQAGGLFGHRVRQERGRQFKFGASLIHIFQFAQLGELQG